MATTKNNCMFKQVVGNTNLELEADAGESILVHDIVMYNPASSYMTVRVDKTTVGYFRVGGPCGSHQCINFTDGMFGSQFNVDGMYTGRSILSILNSIGIFKGYPIAEGQKMTVTGVAQAGAFQVAIYSIGKPGEFTETQQNGSDAKEFVFINYGRPAATIAASGDVELNTPQTPAEFPAFPFGADVPGKYELTVHGLLASDVCDDRGTNDELMSEFLKFIRDREVLFDEDRNGLLLDAPAGGGGTPGIATGTSVAGNASEVDERPPLIFPTPITFESGQELGIYWTIAEGAGLTNAEIDADEAEIALIETAKRL